MQARVRALVGAAAAAAVIAGLVGAQALGGQTRPVASTESFDVATTTVEPTTVAPTTAAPTTVAPEPAPVAEPVQQPVAANAAPAARLKAVPTTQPKPVTGGSSPCAATNARACIDLSANQSWLLDGNGGVTYGPVPITHGRAGWLTPPGTFTVTRKNIDHKSSLFNGAPMPYSVFFNGGIAFHEGSLSEKSHGCIHLSRGAAQTFFKDLQLGQVVQVVP